MIPSVLSSQLRRGVEEFLRTTFPISTPLFENVLGGLFKDDEGIFKGPSLPSLYETLAEPAHEN